MDDEIQKATGAGESVAATTGTPVHRANVASDPTQKQESPHELPHELPDDEEAALALYKHCVEIRNFEITNLVARNNFFMIFQGVLIAGLLQSSGTAPPVVLFLATVCGFGISVCQTLSSSGAKYWQSHWEDELTKIEENYQRELRKTKESQGLPAPKFYRLFKENDEKKTFFGIVKRYSVSKIPIYAGFVFSVIWLTLLLLTLTAPNQYFHEIVESSISGFPKPIEKVK
jgi:hypothetical protein